MELFDENWGKIAYANQKNSNVLHRGQRKLLLAEVSFLACNNHLSNSVLYVGAAPGHHIKILANLFPHKMFYLYDPRDFDEELYQFKNAKIFKQFFTSKDAAEYSGCLFLSDIRTTGVDDKEDFEREVIDNLNMQREWCDIICPKLACLKFRLPYLKNISEYEYYDGVIHLQPWSKFLSNETRLWTDCKKKKRYIISDYEERMVFYNIKFRPQNDQDLEDLIWGQYLNMLGPKRSDISLEKLKNIRC